MSKIKTIFKNINPINTILIICVVVLIASISVLFGYGFCNNGLIVASSKQNVGTYYLIEAGKYDNYEEAVNFANQIKMKGGAGFIRFDDGFRVFLAGYNNKNEAKSVLDKNNEYKSKIYSLSIEEFNFKNGFSHNINNVLKNNIITLKYSIQNLNEVIIDFDKGDKSEIEVKNVCVLILEELQQQIDKFMDHYWLTSTLLKYKNYLHEFYDMINQITRLNVSGVEFSSIVKYQNIGCMFKLQDILKII